MASPFTLSPSLASSSSTGADLLDTSELVTFGDAYFEPRRPSMQERVIRDTVIGITVFVIVRTVAPQLLKVFK